MPRSILVIEDDQDIAHLVGLHVRELCDEVVFAGDGLAGLAAAQSRRHGLIILDLKLPGIDGLEVCRRLRAARDCTPILMLTARSSEGDRVLGLDLGADDYLTKPFNIFELAARVRAIFRRIEVFGAAPAAQPLKLKVGELTIDTESRAIALQGRRVELTAKEFDLLAHFVRHPGRVYSRAQLLDQVWGHGHEGYEHNVNCHINRLRAKIERDPTAPNYILTVWGVGYKFNDEVRVE